MTITPVELHHIRLKRGPLGYRRGPVDELIIEIAGLAQDRVSVVPAAGQPMTNCRFYD